MSAPLYLDLTMYQGADFSYSITLTAADGTFINISSYLFASQLKQSLYNANVAGNLTCTVVDGPNGNLSLSMTAANTGNLAAGKYFYDVLANNAGVFSRLSQGIMTVSAGVTNITPPNQGIPAL